MEICIDAKQLRSALADIEKAEKNGFDHCLAVLKITSVGHMLDDNRLEYLDMIEKAHPTDGSLDWGRFQGVTKRNRFENGRVVPIAASGD